LAARYNSSLVFHRLSSSVVVASLLLCVALLAMVVISCFHPVGVVCVARSLTVRLDVWQGGGRVWLEYDQARRQPSGVALTSELSPEMRQGQGAWDWPAPQHIQSSPGRHIHYTAWTPTPWVRDLRGWGFRLRINQKRRITEY
jgi:hypothetical protein